MVASLLVEGRNFHLKYSSWFTVSKSIKNTQISKSFMHNKNDISRNMLLELHAMNSMQKHWVPNFTEKGFTKDKIPALIYKWVVVERSAL